MVEYSFYYHTYRGSIIRHDEWNLFEAKAAEQLARYKRTYTVSAPEDDAESMAICAMADALAYFEEMQNIAGGAVASAAIGSVSVSYTGVDVDCSPKGKAKELYRCASQYLDICRGVG